MNSRFKHGTSFVFEIECFEPSRDRQGAVFANETGMLPYGQRSEKDLGNTFLEATRICMKFAQQISPGLSFSCGVEQWLELLQTELE